VNFITKLSGLINKISFTDIETANTLVDYAGNVDHDVFGLYNHVSS
jgi:hypothetical protein